MQTSAETGSDVQEPRYSIVIPCYRDEDNLPTLLERLDPVLSQLDGRAELILVDDGSPDRTGVVASELASSYPHETAVVRLLRNFGQHPAVFAGLAESRGQVVITMDSDLQYPPEEIHRLVAELSPEFPVVSGRRENRQDPRLRRLISAWLSRWLARQTGSDVKDFGSMFKAYDREVVDRLLQLNEKRRFLPALVAWMGVPIKEVPVQHEPRSGRGSRYRLAPLIDMFLDLVTGYSVFPLRMLSVLGLLACLLGLIATGGFTVYRIVEGAGVSGLVSAFALAFLLLGVQLLLLALIGEYVGRVYIEAKARPYYVVGEVVRNR